MGSLRAALFVQIPSVPTHLVGADPENREGADSGMGHLKGGAGLDWKLPQTPLT